VSTLRKLFRLGLRAALALLAFLLILGCLGWWYFHPAASVTTGVVYGQRAGQDLTLQVYQPTTTNGLGILIMVSGKWKSSPSKFRPWLAAPLLRQGFTVFAISHLSQPTVSIPATVQDIHRAVRFVRHHAADYGVDPDRLGVTGGSSGGHLSLMLATRGGPGHPTAADPIDRESSAVQAVAAFFPVTDLLNLGPSTENDGTGGPPKSFRQSFDLPSADLEVWKTVGREVSPLYHITPALPPMLLAHGDSDTLVPIDQSLRFREKAAEYGHDVALLTRAGAKHGWLTMFWDLRTFALWFGEVLSQ
jgi:acetyl esterase/lipase